MRDDTRNQKHTHLVLLPMKSQRVMLTKQPRQLKTSTGAVTQRKHQLYKRTKSNPAHRPSISLGRTRASFPLVSTIEQCKHCAVRARKLSPFFCVSLAADFSPHVITVRFRANEARGMRDSRATGEGAENNNKYLCKCKF